MANRLSGTSLALVLLVVLSGCSYSDLLSVIPATATSTIAVTPPPTGTPQPTSTITPTQPTPSFTPTPTLIYLNTAPPPLTIVIPVQTNIAPTNTVAPGTPTVATAFSDVALGVKQIFWGACSPGSTSIKVHVDEASGVTAVLVALRLENPKTADTTPWGGYPEMKKVGPGDFMYQLFATSFSHYHDYISAWGQFQFIGVNRFGDIVARSEEFLHLLVVAPCP